MALVEDAERRGALKPGAILVEPTSGNTGIALAFVAAAKGYQLTLTMPSTSPKNVLLKMLGAKIVFTPGSLMREAVRKAEIVSKTPGAVMLQRVPIAANCKSTGARPPKSGPAPRGTSTSSSLGWGPAAPSRASEKCSKSAGPTCRSWPWSQQEPPSYRAVPQVRTICLGSERASSPIF